MTKPYRIIQIFANPNSLQNKLETMGVKFTSRDILSNGFWGTEFEIEKPKGKGTTNKCREIDQL